MPGPVLLCTFTAKSALASSVNEKVQLDGDREVGRAGRVGDVELPRPALGMWLSTSCRCGPRRPACGSARPDRGMRTGQHLAQHPRPVHVRWTSDVTARLPNDRWRA